MIRKAIDYAGQTIRVKLQPKQWELLRLVQATGPKVATKLGYGGAASGGKSRALREIAYTLATSESCTIFIIRRNFGDLYENHIVRFLDEHPEIAHRYSAGRKEFEIPETGSRIVFRYADTLEEVKAMSRGPEARYVFVDQAEQFSDQELLWLSRPNRDPNADENQCKFVLFFNPGGLGTEYLRRVFWLKQYHGDEKPHQFKFIQAYGWDNYEWFRKECPEFDVHSFYALPDDERFELFIHRTSEGQRLNAFPESIRVGELMGSFEKFSGQYFAGVWDESKCILPISKVEQIIQPWWRRWMGMDWGFADHSCNLWLTAGKLSPVQLEAYFGITSDWPMDIVICYREHVVNETAEKDLAMEIVDKTPSDEKRYLRDMFLSPDAWNKTSSANTVADQMNEVFERHHLPTAEKADTDRIGGWRRLYNGFRQTTGLVGGIADDERAKQGPMLFISSNCPIVISCIPMAVRDDKKAEDVVRAKTLWEDVTDALRYAYKSMPEAKMTAPVEVRYEEQVNSIPDYTQRHLASLQFKQKERSKGVRRSWRG